MAMIDVSDLLRDPELAESVTLIRRSASINAHGETVVTEAACRIVAVIQSDAEALDTLPAGVRLSDAIVVIHCGELAVARPGGYADIIVWRGARYQTREVENYINYGVGFTKSTCVLESVVGGNA